MLLQVDVNGCDGDVDRWWSGHSRKSLNQNSTGMYLCLCNFIPFPVGIHKSMKLPEAFVFALELN